ncbi:hypothetical protein [Bradyrhizobium sp.]|uniref:hypothetical protein n=1 Tax=Bradyrhizobium sp. TaxID=376 RepID=UPI0025C252A4|nr:hypothetical protein [Bradyrhizobium sp.]
MIPKIVSALGAAAVLFASQAVMAADYRPDEFFSLDLSKAVLSAKRLGPAAEFARVPVQASSDHASEPAWARRALNTEPKHVAVQRVAARPPYREARAAPARHRGAARMRLAHRHGNPLDAQAMDTRIQKWPCRSGAGGICNWK